MVLTWLNPEEKKHPVQWKEIQRNVCVCVLMVTAINTDIRPFL